MTAAGSGAPRLTFAKDIRSRPIKWLWEGWLPWGKVVVWEGDPDVGKSLVSLDIVSRATRGENMPDGAECGPAAALLVCAEDGEADTIKPRLAAAGADQGVVAFLQAPEGPPGTPPLSLPSGIDTLRKAIARLRRKTERDRVIVIIDPITAYLDSNSDPNKDSDVRRVTSALARLAEQTGALIVLVRHLNKNVQQSNAKYRGSGSIAWTAAARAVYIFANHPRADGVKVMACTKNNIAPPRPSLTYRLVVSDGDVLPHVEWDGTVELAANDLVRADARKEAPQRDTATDLLRKMLARGGGEVGAREAIKAAAHDGISEASMKRACRELGLHKRKVRRPGEARMVSVWYEQPQARAGDR